MKTTLSVSKKTALTGSYPKDGNRTYPQPKHDSFLFKKHNFCVDVAGTFRVFSYEANYDGDFVSIAVKDARNGVLVLNLHPTIDKIAKVAMFKRHGTLNLSDKTLAVVYEEFCEALFNFVCEKIAEDKDLVEGN